MEPIKSFRRFFCYSAREIAVRCFLLPFCLGLAADLSAQSVKLSSVAPIAPVGSYQTITAYVTGVNNKTVTWSITSSPGGSSPALVGTNPCVVNEPCTIALYTKTPGTYAVTAKSNANASVKASSTVTITPSPAVTAGHPRLMLTPSMLSALRAKATKGNVMYESLRTLGIGAYQADNANFSWSCNSGSGSPKSQQDVGGEMNRALEYAELALVDPSDPTYKWKCYGHDTAVYAMNQLSTRAQTVTGNTWSDNVDAMVLAPDYLIGAGALTSSSDLILTRKYAAFMLKSTMTAQATYGTLGTYNNWNSPSQFDSITHLRAFGNNYTMTRVEYLVGLGLLFDDNPTDDPALPNTCSATRYQVCPDFSAGSMHAYAAYAIGSMLFNMYAHDENPNVTLAAYNASYPGFGSMPQCGYYNSKTPCFGDGRDGESAEGSWYQYSIYRLRYALNMLHTAGYDNPAGRCLGAATGTSCPQLSLATSSWWDMKLISDISFLDGWNTPQTNNQPAFGFFNTGDANQVQRWPNDFQAEVAALTDDSIRGRTDRSNAILWLAFNTALGGPRGNKGSCTPNYYCGFDTGMTSHFSNNLIWDLMISQPAGDPTGGALPADPRPSLPPDTFQGGFTQHVEVHSGTGTGWGGYESTFNFYCINSSTDHEHSPCGRYDIVSSIGGHDEYITHGRSDFADYSYLGTTALNSNIPQIFNATASECSTGTVYANLQAHGGQWWYAQQQTAPIHIAHAELPAYVATDVDDTGMYNSNRGGPCAGANDVTEASRTLIYLRKTRQVITFDRTATGKARQKVNTLVTSGNPTVTGNYASWTTPSGNQKAYFTSLLPGGVNPSGVHLTSANDKYVEGGSLCEGNGYCEPFVNGRITVDAGMTTSANFLSVLEWGSSKLTRSTTSLVQSSSGESFDGAVVGSSLVLFMRAQRSFTGMTYPASGATTHYIANLAPNAEYNVSGPGAPSSVTADNAGVVTFAASGTGSIAVSPGRAHP
jgi:hypothetical protein